MIAGKQWDLNRVQTLAKTSFTVDVMYLLSMFHWMDRYIRDFINSESIPDSDGFYSCSGERSVSNSSSCTGMVWSRVNSITTWAREMRCQSVRNVKSRCICIFKSFFIFRLTGYIDLRMCKPETSCTMSFGKCIRASLQCFK